MDGKIKFRIKDQGNGTYIASIIESSTAGRNVNSTGRDVHEEEVQALYYVLAVIFIYGLSIVMMIASIIRKNNLDRKLNQYLKEMAIVRKREQQMKFYSAAAKLACTESGQNGDTAAKFVGQYTAICEEDVNVTKQTSVATDSKDLLCVKSVHSSGISDSEASPLIILQETPKSRVNGHSGYIPPPDNNMASLKGQSTSLQIDEITPTWRQSPTFEPVHRDHLDQLVCLSYSDGPVFSVTTSHVQVVTSL